MQRERGARGRGHRHGRTRSESRHLLACTQRQGALGSSDYPNPLSGSTSDAASPISGPTPLGHAPQHLQRRNVTRSLGSGMWSARPARQTVHQPRTAAARRRPGDARQAQRRSSSSAQRREMRCLPRPRRRWRRGRRHRRHGAAGPQLCTTPRRRGSGHRVGHTARARTRMTACCANHAKRRALRLLVDSAIRNPVGAKTRGMQGRLDSGAGRSGRFW